jgi:two-component system chemotaxis response regulator CheB
MTHRVLIVDDSELFSDLLTDILQRDGAFEIVGVARNGREATRMAQHLRPDVITMDLLMPEMDGLSAVESIMATCPAPILVLTEDARSDLGDLTFEALRRGALDVRRKPTIVSRVETQALRHHLGMLAEVRVGRARASREPRTASDPGTREALVVVGVVASTGGPAAVSQLLKLLPRELPGALVIVQHLPEGFVSTFVEWLRRSCEHAVRLAVDGERLSPGDIVVAPDRHDIVLSSHGRICLIPPTGDSPHCPSGDVLFSSLSNASPKRSIGVVLTGMGRDGATGLDELRRSGGVTFAQDEATSVVYGMPKVAVESGAAQRSVPLDDIAATIAAEMERLT